MSSKNTRPRILFLNLGWPDLISKKTYKVHLSLPPLDLIYLHSIAKQHGLDSKIVDAFVNLEVPLENFVREADWIVATTTPYHMWQCPNSDWDWLRGSLSHLPSNKLVLTGLHGSVFPEKTLRETAARFLIRREPEVVFQHFLRSGAWEDCPGMSWLENDRYQESPLAELPALDEIVATHYDVDIASYRYFLLGRKTGIFESSRGCPWKCNFCDQEMHSWSYRTKSPTVFAQEVENAVRQTGMKTAYFYDMEFTIGKKRTLEVTDALCSTQVPQLLDWACQTRADQVDEETLRALRNAGCRLIHFGVESANPEILKATNKKITLEKIEHGVRLAKEAKLETACFFMFGLPEENPSTFDNTLNFARRLNPTYASFHFAIPFPGTPLYQRYVEETQTKWGEWPSTYFRDWEHKDITNYLKAAYLKFYLFPRSFEVREFMHRLRHIDQKLEYFFSL